MPSLPVSTCSVLSIATTRVRTIAKTQSRPREAKFHSLCREAIAQSLKYLVGDPGASVFDPGLHAIR